MRYLFWIITSYLGLLDLHSRYHDCATEEVDRSIFISYQSLIHIFHTNLHELDIDHVGLINNGTGFVIPF
jgi:hypothetical protein